MICVHIDVHTHTEVEGEGEGEGEGEEGLTNGGLVCWVGVTDRGGGKAQRGGDCAACGE